MINAGMPTISFLILVLSLGIIVGLFVLYFWFKKGTQLQDDFAEYPPKDATYQFIDQQFVNKMKLTKDGELIKNGEKLIQRKVFSIYLIHGTFVGDDPMHILALLEKTFAKFNPKIFPKVREKTKFVQNLMAQDLGNFTKKHNDYLAPLFQNKVFMHNFTWSSGNHHYARVVGTFKLMRDLFQKHNKRERILLVGHSHAGQLFALLGQILSHKIFAKQILEIFHAEIQADEFYQLIAKLKTFKLDFVTMGCPVRYRFALTGNMRLLHFINHRTLSLRGGPIEGFYSTQRGDYIQQWGVAGSDIISPSKRENLLNQKCEDFLGSGANLASLRKNSKLRKRLHNLGHHFLVDYADNANYPNFLLTIFGHGVYTKIDHLKFHFHLINKYFYDK